MTPADIQDLYADLVIELRGKTIKELRKIATIQNIKGRSKMNKKKLLKELFDDGKWINEKLLEAEKEKGRSLLQSAKKSSRKREKKQCVCIKQHLIKRGIKKGIVKCDKRHPKGCHLTKTTKTKKTKKSSRKRKKKQCVCTKQHTIKRGTNKGKIKCDKRNPKGCHLSENWKYI